MLKCGSIDDGTIAVQLSKKNTRFQYKLIKKGARAAEYENAIQWLVTEKIKAVRKMCVKAGLPDMHIEVDGGVDTVTYKDVVKAGADVLVAGSAVYGAADRAAVIRTLKGE